MPETFCVKWRAGKYMVPVTKIIDKQKIVLKFGYNPALITEVKAMAGARWNPDAKCWTITNNIRNQFQIEYLEGGNPYARYDTPIVEHPHRRESLREHQRLMLNFALTRKTCVLACEMGTGKTLAAIELCEYLQQKHGKINVWYVGPRAGVRAVYREIKKWDCQCPIKMFTYERLVQVIKNWTPDEPAPHVVIFDESSKIKTASAQRTQAAMHLANAIREEHHELAHVILMTGTPAPKDPVDWWSQAETAQPGFLRYGTPQKMRYDLAKIEQRETLSGGAYPHLVCWWDDENKCQQCGLPKDDKCHHPVNGDHIWIKSENKVQKLFAKLDGLALVMFKKDVLSLPPKIYEEVLIKPGVDILRHAQMIRKTQGRAITVLSKLRELADGFQYETVETGDMIQCPRCQGTGMVKEPDEEGQLVEFDCPTCEGTGEVERSERRPRYIGTPKEQTLKEDIEDLDRVVIWGGFTATIDRLCEILVADGWAVLRVDGRGYKALGTTHSSEELLAAMDSSTGNCVQVDKIAFVGHPKAGGMALTLTASGIEIFYSNAFDGEARIQAEDRCHRLGMRNQGLVIRDYHVLPSCKLVLDNLKKKKKLQSLTMGDLNDGWSNAEIELQKLEVQDV